MLVYQRVTRMVPHQVPMDEKPPHRRIVIPQVAFLLIEAKANLNLPENTRGSTPLHVTCSVVAPLTLGESEMGWRNGLRLSQSVADLLCEKNLGMKIHLGYPIWTSQIHYLKWSKKTPTPKISPAKIMGRSYPIPWAWVSQNHQSREWSVVQIQTMTFSDLEPKVKAGFWPSFTWMHQWILFWKSHHWFFDEVPKIIFNFGSLMSQIRNHIVSLSNSLQSENPAVLEHIYWLFIFGFFPETLW